MKENSLTKVLYLYEKDMATVSVFRESIERKNAEKQNVSVIKSVVNVKRKEIEEADIIYLIRPNNSLAYSIAKYAKRSNKYLVVFSDDDLYYIVAQSYIDKTRKKHFRNILALADIIITNSPRIAEKYKPLCEGNRSFKIDTTVFEDEIQEHPSVTDRPIKIVYAAGVSHAPLFDQYVLPVLKELIDEYGKMFSLTFVGVHPELTDEILASGIVRYAPLMPLREYREYMYNEMFDVGLAPLNHDEFSKCKYYNKYIEYSMCGVVGLYSDTEPYTFAIKNRENGLLVSDSPMDWKAAIELIIQDDGLRHRCIENAQQDLRNTFSNEANEKRIHDQVPELFSYKADSDHSCKCWWLAIAKTHYHLNNVFSYSVTSLEHVREHGVASVIKKISDHLKNTKAYQSRTH